MITDRLWRVGGIALVLALVANVLLLWIVDDDAFAYIVAIGSAVAALGLIVVHYVTKLGHLIGEALLLSMAVWIANAIEFGLEDNASWESRCRQCGFYLAFALLSLGMFLVSRLAGDRDGR